MIQDAGVDPASPYVALDADGHVIESDELVAEYLAPALRERTAGFALNAERNRRFIVDGVEHPPFPKEISIRKPMRAEDRLKVLDKERIRMAVLFPSAGLIAGYIDGEFGHGYTEAYNRWMADYVAPHRDRLAFAAPVALQDVNRAVAEAGRAVEAGAVGVAIRPNPVLNRRLDDRAYDPFYAALQDMGVPLIVHETTGCPHTAGGDRFGGMMDPESYAMHHVVSHPFEQMLAMMSMILGGVLERFPALSVGFMEAGCSWAPYWLARLDDHFENPKLRPYMADLSMPPSDYFRRQCVVTCDPGDPTIPLAIEGVGADRILFATDYPHFDSSAGAVNGFLAVAGVSPEDQRRILWDNSVAFYGLDLAR